MPSHTRISYEYTRTHTHTLSVGAADRHQDSRSWILVAECWMLASDSAASYYNSSLIFNFQCISLFAAAAFPALPPLSTEFISMNWGMAQLAARLATGNKFPHCKLTRMHKFIYFSPPKKKMEKLTKMKEGWPKNSNDSLHWKRETETAWIVPMQMQMRFIMP